jgi:hypothetical protein
MAAVDCVLDALHLGGKTISFDLLSRPPGQPLRRACGQGDPRAHALAQQVALELRQVRP